MNQRRYTRKATKIAEYHDDENRVFIQFEDCTYADSIRVFMNNHDNTMPSFFFIPVKHAAVLFWDMFNGSHIHYRKEAEGQRRGKYQFRTFEVTTTPETTRDSAYYNFYLENETDTNVMCVIVRIPISEARLMAISVLPYVKKWLEDKIKQKG